MILQIRMTSVGGGLVGGMQQGGQETCNEFYHASAGAPALPSAAVLQHEQKFNQVRACTSMGFF